MLLMPEDVADCKLVDTPAPLAVAPTGSCAATFVTVLKPVAAFVAGLLPDA
jgi:hypothetical protein